MRRGVAFLLLREGAILGGESGCIHKALADGERVTEPADR